MNKILLIIPYFGRLPNWFQQFCDSSSRSEIVDFLLITDDRSEFEYPSNFKVEYGSFDDIKQLFKRTLGNLYIEHPYKLCDYKPTYGEVFKDYLTNYSYWGHADIDVIWGDLDQYLIRMNYLQYDRLFNVGHLSIYRNNPKINNLFKLKLDERFPQLCNFSFAAKTTYPCHFDEIGMNIICKEFGIKFFDGKFSKNVNMNYYNFAVDGGKPKVPQLIVYDNGKLYIKRKNTVGMEELMYALIQKRKLTKNLRAKTDKYIITADGFIDIIETEMHYFFSIYGLNDNYNKQKEYLKSFHRLRKNASYNKLKQEFIHFPLRIAFNIWHRRQGILFLKEKNLY